MGLFRIEIQDKKFLTEEEQRYYDIIQSSIDRNIEKEALIQVFDSVYTWRKHKAWQSNHKLKCIIHME